ncbi:Hypothetical predicted protein [Olea europaea subsp. europaea]|uniref:Uncharacterized protein n=1 Tax=Olea europaea subsp. europaea TaxID=158383 RepID=A0A8S0PM32_OLEEU|nr:Hypothetical predicted protein [Olea europaea subsp. europaea]
MSMQFLGLGVQAKSEMRHGHGHVKNALGPQQGRSLIFRKLWLVSGDGEQAMSGTPPGQVGMQPDFQAFLGSLWTWCVAQVRDACWPRHRRSLIFRHFYTISGTWCAGQVRDVSWPRQGCSLIFRHF